MSFVWVTADLDVPAHSGGQIRAARLISSLATVAPVDLVLLAARADADAVQRVTGVRSVRYAPPQKAPLRKRMRAVARRLPVRSAGILDSAELAWIASQDGAVVIADHLQAAPYLRAASVGVLNLHNADAALLSEETPRPGTLRRVEHQWETATIRRLERWAVQRASTVVCVSELDAKRVRADALIVPNGTDLPTNTTSVPSGRSVLFVGSLDYPPNEEAVRWWLAEVAPRLPAGLPPLTVVGRSAARVLSDLREDPRLVVHSDVPDVRPFLDDASVVVQPLLRGGGSRLKLVEALGHRRPVVATGRAAEGFPVVDGLHLALADAPDEFARSVAAVFRNHDLANRLADAGRVFAQDYDWHVIGVRFAQKMRALAPTAPLR